MKWQFWKRKPAPTPAQTGKAALKTAKRVFLELALLDPPAEAYRNKRLAVVVGALALALKDPSVTVAVEDLLPVDAMAGGEQRFRWSTLAVGVIEAAKEQAQG